MTTFANLPQFDPAVPATKIFCIGGSCLRSALVRIAVDKTVPRGVAVHFPGGASSLGETSICSSPENTVRLLSGVAQKFIAAGYATPDGDPLALIDIVTYPLYLSLIYDIPLTEAGTELFAINHNWLTGAFPELPTRGAGVLSAFHFNEEPIDDAPTHNIVVPSDFSPGAIARLTAYFARTAVPLFWTTRSNPQMDDRYLFAERQPGDGPPNRLLADS